MVVFAVTEVSAILQPTIIPNKSFSIGHNYPNPFNLSTSIEYFVSQNTHVIIRIFNSNGQEISTLVNEPQTAGEKRVVWNALDYAGNPLSSGIYFYRFEIENNVINKKMLLMK